MTAVAFPIAASAEAALAAPLGRAARQSQAAALAGQPVAFVTEATGPAFASREAALDVYAGRLDDERPGRVVSVQPEDRYCVLRELAAAPPPAASGRPRGAGAMRPVYRDGRRWPPPPPRPETVWRLSVSYWRVGGAAAPVLAAPEPAATPAASRRARAAAADDPALLRRLADQPLRPAKVQKALDIGLFEFRPPEAPHIVMPDE